MFPSAGLQVPDARTFGDFDTLVRSSYFANTFDLNAVDGEAGAERFRFYREEQLEIFTAVQRELQRIERATPHNSVT